jgi:enediyne biosynthesis protein E4
MEPSPHPSVKRIAAIIIAALLFIVAWMHRPVRASAGRSLLTNGRFNFTRYELPTLPGPQQKVRRVNPSLANISGWISAVGAAVALNDIDGDGLPNDVCYVDTRTDQVIVEPAPGTPARYHAFALDPSPLKVDRQTVAPMGCLPGDFDEDGRIDLLVYYWGRTPIIFLNRYDAKKQNELSASSFQPVELVPEGGRWFTNAAILADLDGDGHADILVGNYFPDGANILNPNSSHIEHMQDSMSHAFNGGGKHFLLWQPPKPDAPVAFREVTPELLVGNYQLASPSLREDILHGWTLAAAAADLNGDLLPELYIANDFGPDRLLENLSRPGELKFRLLIGKRSFFMPKSKVLGRDSFKGMGAEFADINGDGRMDILVSNITDEFALEESNFAFISTGSRLADESGYAQFEDQSEELGISRSGWSWDIKAADFDNDGKLEIVQATGFLNSANSQPGIDRWPELHEIAMGNDVLLQHPKQWHRFQGSDALSYHDSTPFYVQNDGDRYEDVSQEIGLAHQYAGRGIAVADVDGNGLLDFAIANQWGTSEFYKNASKTPGASLTLKLLLPTDPATGQFRVVKSAAGEVPGSPAIGACADIRLPDGKSLVEQVDGGNGHSGKSSFELHFGLGAQPATTEYPIELKWRSRDGQMHNRKLALAAGRYSIVLGE